MLKENEPARGLYISTRRCGRCWKVAGSKAKVCLRVFSAIECLSRQSLQQRMLNSQYTLRMALAPQSIQPLKPARRSMSLVSMDRAGSAFCPSAAAAGRLRFAAAQAASHQTLADDCLSCSASPLSTQARCRSVSGRGEFEAASRILSCKGSGKSLKPIMLTKPL